MNQTHLSMACAMRPRPLPHGVLGRWVGHWLIASVLCIQAWPTSNLAWAQGLGATPTATAGAAPPGDKAQVLSMNFQNIEMRAALQVIADFTGLNVVVSDSVTGHIPAELPKADLLQAQQLHLQGRCALRQLAQHAGHRKGLALHHTPPARRSRPCPTRHR